MNIYRILLELTRMHADPATLERVLDSLGSAVRASSSAIARAEESGIEDYIDAVVDDECAVVEDLVGAALVASQAEINGVVSNTMQLHERAKDDGHALATTDGTRRAILTFGTPPVKSSTYSQIQDRCIRKLFQASRRVERVMVGGHRTIQAHHRCHFSRRC